MPMNSTTRSPQAWRKPQQSPLSQNATRKPPFRKRGVGGIYTYTYTYTPPETAAIPRLCAERRWRAGR